jgi:hypothetical protein
MKATLFKEVSYTLSKLIEDIDMGEIGLPDIQRPFVWTPAKVRDLFDSMYRGFPVGYLLFWSNNLADGTRQIGSNPKQKVPRLLIVDGQQRLTSLYAVLKARPVVSSDFTEQRLHIAFRPRDERFEVTDAAIRKDPEYIPDISQLWAGELPRHKFTSDFIQRVKASREVSDAEEDHLFEAIDSLYDLQNYPFTALELSSSVDEEQVADVFVRINSKGVTLNQADFILTLMSVFWDEGRAQLEHFCRKARQPSAGEASPFNHFIQPDPDQLLRVSVALAFRRARLEHVYSILRGKDLETGQFSEERRLQQFGLLEAAQRHTLNLQNWHEFLKVLVRAGYRSSSMISSKVGLVYSYGMYLIGKHQYGVDPYELRDIIARWFYFTALTARYSGSPESTMEEDLARLRGVQDAGGFRDTLDQVIAGQLTDDFWAITLPSDLATSSARSPSLFAYYAALNLLDARVLLSKMTVRELLDPALKANKSSLERHHLFPRNYLKKQGVTDLREVNQIGNFALVEWSDNIDISDAAPSAYFPQYVEDRQLSLAVLQNMHYWHALPDGWETLSYEDFLAARRRGIARVIRDGFTLLAGKAQPVVA